MTLEERKTAKEELLKALKEIEKEERAEAKKEEKAEREKINALLKKKYGISLSEIKSLLKGRETLEKQKIEMGKFQNDAAAWQNILQAYGVKNGAEAQAVYAYIMGQNIIDFFHKNARQE